MFYVVQSHINPYYDDRLNNLEKISLFVLIMTIYCGLFFQAGKEDTVLENSIVKWVIFAMVFIPSCIFLIYFVDKLRTEILRKLVNYKLFFKIISCGLINLTEFKEDHANDDVDSLEEFDQL